MKMFIYIVDGVEYKTDQKIVTGLFIMSMLPSFERGYSLFKENTDVADEYVSTTTTISLENTKRFYTVPPAFFS